MTNRAVGIGLMAGALFIAAYVTSTVLGWETVLQLAGVMLLTVAVCLLFLAGVFLAWPPK